jgi:hypothetical protein
MLEEQHTKQEVDNFTVFCKSARIQSFLASETESTPLSQVHEWRGAFAVP